MAMEVKICGLTQERETQYLSLDNCKADYAGFVFFEKSKRNVSMQQAKKIMTSLEGIKSVAVTVSPDVELVEGICNAGFDVLQIHKKLTEEVLSKTSIPVWYAFNISDKEEINSQRAFLNTLPENLLGKIQGIVIDAADFGSGKTFEWNKALKEELGDIIDGRKFILAGGLNTDNIKQGIELFEPDVVDVSSGVEKDGHKDEMLVNKFIKIAKGKEV